MKQTPEILLRAKGPRAAEVALLDWVGRNRACRPEDLRRPMRIIVPSRSLQRGIQALLVGRFGALAGVVVQTHLAFVRDLLRADDSEEGAEGNSLLALLLRRLASGVEDLRGDLSGYEDGYAAINPALRDLIDAGLDETNLGAALEAIAAAHLSPAVRQRSLDILKIAAACLQGISESNRLLRSQSLHAATEVLRQGQGPEGGWGNILLFGYADATGLLTDFLQALCTHSGATIIIDQPPHAWDQGGVVEDFSLRLSESLGFGYSSRKTEVEMQPRLEAFRAPDPKAQVREVAGRIRRLLDRGEAPEGIAILSRQFTDAFLLSLKTQLQALAIPFSAEGASLPAGEALRSGRSLFRLMDETTKASLEDYFSLQETSSPSDALIRREELAFRSLGLSWIGQVLSHSPEELSKAKDIRLPMVEGLTTPGDRFQHGMIDRGVLAARATDIISLSRHLSTRPKRASIEVFLKWVRRTLNFFPAWETTEAQDATFGLGTLQAEIPSDLVVSWDELGPVLHQAFQSCGRTALGGAGGGVQVLSVMEARSRCFDHVFLMNCNRGVFPRPNREDALFPDDARRALLPVLPQIPLASRGSLEEIHLFSQILDSAGVITLSWPEADVSGRSLGPSVFILSLSLSGRLPASIELVADVYDVRSGLRPPLEASLHYILEGGLGALHRLPLDRLIPAFGDEARAKHFRAVLEDVERGQGPSAFLGWTGEEAPKGPLWVTQLEKLAICPWKYYLENRLGLQAPPRGLDLREGLHRLVGSTVHGVLEKKALQAGIQKGLSLRDLQATDVVRVRWPERSRLEELLRQVAEEIAQSEGRLGLAPVIAALAAPYLERARESDWEAGFLDILGVEVQGSCKLVGKQGSTQLHFRADRVDVEEGRWWLTDYKTGHRPTGKVSTAIKKGRLLQGAAYASSLDGEVIGRYLYLAETLRDRRELEVLQEDLESFPPLIEMLVDARETAIYFPRLGGTACRYCQLKEACCNGDAGMTRRLKTAMLEIEQEEAEHPILGLWNLNKQGKAPS